MNNRRFEISNIDKMIDGIKQIKQLYEELSEETREKLENSFEWGNKPLVVINHLEIVLSLTHIGIVLDDCLEKTNEMLAEDSLSF